VQSCPFCLSFYPLFILLPSVYPFTLTALEFATCSFIRKRTRYSMRTLKLLQQANASGCIRNAGFAEYTYNLTLGFFNLSDADVSPPVQFDDPVNPAFVVYDFQVTIPAQSNIIQLGPMRVELQ